MPNSSPRSRAALATVLFAVAIMFCAVASAGAAPSASAAGSLLQFTAGGHVVGFESGGLYVASADHLVRIDFAGGRAVAPKAGRGAESEGAAVAAGDGATASGPGDVTPLERVAYRGVWPGVTVVYEGAGSGAILKSSYHVAAGDPEAAAGRIALAYNRDVSLDASGELVVAYEGGELRESAPVAWQTIAGARVPVEVRFRLLGDRRVGFAVGACDPRHPLVIDPSLTWVAFFGGGSDDYSRFIARDSSGNLYVVGDSSASWQGADAPLHAYSDKTAAYVAKLDSSGALLWNTFLGGTGEDSGNGIVLDASGNVYATGTSDASWGSPARAYSGSTDCWIAKLDGSGDLQWNTFLGSADKDQGFSVAVGGGDLYAGGWSNASWESPIRAHEGSSIFDAFVARLDPSDGALTWNTFLGGDGSSEDPDTLPSTWLAADSSSVYVSAVCNAEWTVDGLTAVRAYTPGADGYDGYAVKLSSAGAIAWYTFLGGAGNDVAFGVTAPTSGGDLYVCGSSTLTWGSPPSGGTHTSGANYDGFLAKLVGASGVLSANTFFGSDQQDDANALALDGGGNVYVAGTSWKTWGTSPSPLRAFSTSTDGFLVKFNSSLARQWNTFLGGSGNGDQIWGVAVDGDGNSYSAGYSNAAWQGTSAPLRPYTLAYDGFVAKVDTSGALQWNTFQGGGSDCFSRWIARDSSGNLYVVGDSTATWGAPKRSFQGTRDCFVAKLDSGGTVQWNTFLGGSGTDHGYGVAVDAGGNVYATGTSTGSWPSTPTPLNAYAGGVDVFVTKLDSGGVLQWNTFMGSTANDESFSLAIGSSPDVALYVGGWSNATWGQPVRAHEGNMEYDAFVARVTTDGAVAWNTFLGGYGTTLDPPNHTPNTWVATVGDYVCASAVCDEEWEVAGMEPRRAYSAGYDGYGVRLTAADGEIDAYAFLGGSGHDIVYGIAFDTVGNAYFSGSSDADWGSPVVAHSGGGNFEAWAVQMDDEGDIKWNTFFGSATEDNDGNAIAADASGNVYVVGTTYDDDEISGDGDWGTPWRAYGAGEAGFIVKLTSAGAFVWNGFLGGTGKDDAWGVVLGGSGSALTAYVVGGSDATWGSPAAASAFKEGTDGFVAAVSLPGAVWTGASTVNSNWSTAANWAAGTAPEAGEALAFAAGAARKANVNDLLSSVGQVGFAEGGYSVSLDATITATTLNENVDMAMTSTGDNEWAVATVLPGTQTRKIATLSGTLTMSGVISGGGTVSKQGPGALTLSAQNTYTGATWIYDGWLNAADIVVDGGASNLGNAATAVVTGWANDTLGMLNYTGPSVTFTRGCDTKRGGGIRVADGDVTVTVTGSVTASGGALTFGGPGGIVVSSDITGNGSLTKTGAGSLTLSGANTYPGITRIHEGTVVANTLVADVPSSLGKPTSGSAKTIALGDAATAAGLVYTGPTATCARSVVLGALGGELEVDSANVLTISGALTGAGGLTKSGPGTLELTFANSYLGDTSIEEGTLRQGVNNNRLPYGPGKGDVTVATGATLDLYGYMLAINGLSGAGSVTNSNAALSTYLSVGYNDATSTFDGVISDVGANPGLLRLTKYGKGTLTLTGANTYIGATTVSAGTLLVNGSIVSSGATALVNPGTTLGGSGTIDSEVTTSGVLAPGAGAGSVGTLTTLRQIWNGGGQYTVDITDTVGPAGVGYDSMELTGNLSINVAVGSTFTVKLVGTAEHWAAGGTYRWPIARYTGTISGFDAAKFTLDTSDFTNEPSGAGMSLVSNEASKTVDIVHAAYPTAVTVASFGAKLRKGRVVAEWKTASLGTSVGFHLYRKSLKTGKWLKINRSLIPAKFEKPAGATYTVVDSAAPTGKRLTYRLKEIGTRGDVKRYGPYRVKPVK